jgi:hypothetical protein
MRPFIAIAIWIALVGGLGLYMSTRPVPEELPAYERSQAEGAFSLEITTSFTAAPDPFALRTEEAPEATSLIIQLNGKEVFRSTGRLDAGRTIEMKPLRGLVIGENEFYIEANPTLEQAMHAHALRIRLLRGAETLAERTFWSGEGVRLATVFSVTIQASEGKKDNAHGS